MPKITIDTEVLQKMIQDSVRTSMAELQSLPSCKIEELKMSAFKADLDNALTILVGNGNPERGLVYKFGQTEKDVRRIVNGIWAFVIVGIGLLTTAIWNILLVK